VAAGGAALTARVLLVDDHPFIRAGLRGMLDADPALEVVGEAADGEEAVAQAAALAPDVVLMDLSMPRLDGIAATTAILAAAPATRVLVLTSFGDRRRVQQALRAGAIGYLLKDSEPETVVAAVRSAAAGDVPVDPRVAGALLPAPPRRPDLSPREEEVLALIAEGFANKQIAHRLGIAERTVKVHVGNVFKRIGVADRTSAAIWLRDHPVER